MATIAQAGCGGAALLASKQWHTLVGCADQEPGFFIPQLCSTRTAPIAINDQPIQSGG
jgi:hypothetical protein